MFIYARPLLPVIAALGVAFLILWLEREYGAPPVVSLDSNTTNPTITAGVPERPQLTKL